ncbi:unnamed protein product [Sphagnum troendelagicum]|uniref:Uncharacterized protein n=1 Tax=Sphagnum troendelagicum TaxID=128251 RepID=A0ABP0UQR7_9BRYO
MTVFSASFAPPEFFAGWGYSTIVRRKVLEKTDLNCVKNWCIAACSTQSPTRRFHDFSLKRLCVTKRCRATNLVGDMDGSDGGGLQMGVEIDMRELQDADAIVSLANDAGQISICGFGSLLSEKSARSTFPNLQNFRVGVLRDLRRVFIHATPVFFDRGIANLDTKEISSVCVEPCKGESIIVTVFEIFTAEVPAFVEREHEFRFLAIWIESKGWKEYWANQVVCSKYSDEEYRRIRCKGSEAEFNRRYGRHKIQKVYRDDILPCRVYLRHCILASKNLGPDAYENFLDHSYLGDRTTTIRKYLESPIGRGIMDEVVPASLHDRYGG